VDIAIVAEPYWVPSANTRWAADPTGQAVALTWRHGEMSLPCTFVEAGEGFVTAKWGKWLVVGVYIPPRRNRTEMEGRLDLIKGCIDRHPSWPALVARDFNAHSTKWGNPATDSAGIAVEEWAASLGLVLLKRLS